MSLRELFDQDLPEDFPNGLAPPVPTRGRLPLRPWLLAGLVILCLLPRAALALRARAVCPDGALYIELAQALAAGDLQQGMREVHLNTYPALLALLHAAGLDWELAGKWWGVGISSLVVLPLFGWARRQFDDRVALVACVLYAFHANFIEWSPEVLRDPTFWFLFAASIYCLWRAVAEVRLAWFAAAGLSIGLAVLTRFEGLLLLVPLGLWSAWRLRALSTARGRLVMGVVVCLGVCPALAVAANLVLLRGLPRWEFARLEPLVLLARWLHGLWAASPPAPDTAGWIVEPLPSLGPARYVWKFLNTMERGLTPAFALLMFLGIWRWRRVWARRDHQALFYTALALVGGICINLWWTRTPCFRYPLPIALLGSVFAALGLMAVTRWLLRIGRRRQWPARWQPLLAAAPLVLVIGLGLVDALTRNYQPRIASARLGRWVAAERRPATVLGSPDTLLRISAHYAGARYASFAEYETVEEIAAQARVLKPDVILLSPRRVRPERLGPLVEDLCRAGFAPIDPSRLPPGCQHMSVLVPAAIRPARSPQRIAQWDCSPSLF